MIGVEVAPPGQLPTIEKKKPSSFGKVLGEMVLQYAQILTVARDLDIDLDELVKLKLITSSRMSRSRLRRREIDARRDGVTAIVKTASSVILAN
jgi:hypothetical protein